MKKSSLLCLAFAGTFTLFSCGSADTPSEKTEDSEADAAVAQMLSEEAQKKQDFSDEAMRTIEAFKEDKTTITVKDLPKDGGYNLLEKSLYLGDKNEKLAVVYGISPAGKPSVAIVQKEGGKASDLLTQTGDLNAKNPTFSDSKGITLETTSEGIVLTMGGKTTAYKLHE